MAIDWTQPVQIALHDIHTLRIYTDWGQKSVGFGQLALGVQVHKEDGKVCMRITGDTEAMGREWVRQALHAVADTLADALPERGLTGRPVDVPIPAEVLAHWSELDRLMNPPD
jgi:hypothetical protein